MTTASSSESLPLDLSTASKSVDAPATTPNHPPAQTSSIPAELFELLGNDDKMAVSLSTMFPGGLPVSLDSVNSSIFQGTLFKYLFLLYFPPVHN